MTDAKGSAGDRTANLMWRLQNGEAPAVLHTPRAIVLLIGCNDLTYASFQVHLLAADAQSDARQAPQKSKLSLGQ